jgi:FixJ family two-component response regulator
LSDFTGMGDATSTPVVFVVDDDPSVRGSLEMLISEAGWIPETFETARAFLERAPVDGPSCLILDVSLPGLNGLELQQQIAGRNQMPIIFISGHGDIPITVRAMKAGAIEFLTKPYSADALLAAVRDALTRSQSALGALERLRALRACYASLTRRECEVMQLVVCGLLNKQVGGELNISEITVKTHRGSVMRKMNADSFADLVNMAAELGVGSARKR